MFILPIFSYIKYHKNQGCYLYVVYSKDISLYDAWQHFMDFFGSYYNKGVIYQGGQYSGPDQSFEAYFRISCEDVDIEHFDNVKMNALELRAIRSKK